MRVQAALFLSLLSGITNALPAADAASAAAKPPAFIAPATYDGVCYYPAPAANFNLTSYLGRWYQVAGTSVPYTAGCSCTYAEYSDKGNGTVGVLNVCQRYGKASRIEGTASPVDTRYGAGGVFKVKFPYGFADECAGPNYIVQEYSEDGQWAIVQASSFSTLFLLTRNPKPGKAAIDAWLAKAAKLGSDLDEVISISQEGCKY